MTNLKNKEKYEIKIDVKFNEELSNENNKRQSVVVSISLRNAIGKKIIEGLSGAVKMFNLYKMNLKRNKEKKKIMISIK